MRFTIQSIDNGYVVSWYDGRAGDVRNRERAVFAPDVEALKEAVEVVVTNPLNAHAQAL